MVGVLRFLIAETELIWVVRLVLALFFMNAFLKKCCIDACSPSRFLLSICRYLRFLSLYEAEVFLFLFPEEYFRICLYFVARFLFYKFARLFYENLKPDFFITAGSFVLFNVGFQIECQKFPSAIHLGFIVGHWFFGVISILTTQAVILLFHKNNAVYILSSGLSADSSHIYMFIHVGNTRFEIGKKAHPDRIDEIFEDSVVGEMEVFVQTDNKHPPTTFRHFFLPPMGYGVLGITDMSIADIKIKLNKIVEGKRYDTSSHSCQEVAFSVAHKVVNPEDSIENYLTTTKALLLLFGFYSIILGINIFRNVKSVDANITFFD